MYEQERNENWSANEKNKIDTSYKNLLHQINKLNVQCTQVSHTPWCETEKLYSLHNFFFLDNTNNNI